MSERIASDVLAYLDELHVIGYFFEHALAISWRAASRLEYVGVQEAARKRRIDNILWAVGYGDQNIIPLPQGSPSEFSKTFTKKR